MSAPVIVLADLEAAAAKATPGPWFAVELPWNSVSGFVIAGNSDPHAGTMVADCGCQHDDSITANAANDWNDAAYIATASPATVAALCAALRECCRMFEYCEGVCREHGIVLDPREPAAGETPLKMLDRFVGALRRSPAEPAKTHDYRNRGKGHDYTFDPIDGGKRGKMMGWGHGIEEGDYLILEQPPSGSRYRVERIEYYRDPPDMWRADVVFAPRTGVTPAAEGETRP